MSQITGITEEKNVLKRKAKPTLVRRVSDMFKDGNYSGPPRLFRNASMQRIRHCCQNLNLLPYLLYSFDNSKSHPIARKAHVYLSRFFHDIVVISVLASYESLRRSVLRGFRAQEAAANAQTPAAEAKLPASEPAKPAARFGNIRRPKRKQNPFYLIAAVYLVPLLLIFQVTTLCNLTMFGKCNPGFIFLISALLLLGGIALKILLHGTVLYGNSKCERKKVQ